jgi:hypothetical protein
LSFVACAVFTASELAQDVLPVPADPSPVKRLDHHAAGVEQASVRFVHRGVLFPTYRDSIACAIIVFREFSAFFSSKCVFLYDKNVTLRDFERAGRGRTCICFMIV